MSTNEMETWTVAHWQVWASVGLPPGTDLYAAFLPLCTSIGRTSRALRKHDRAEARARAADAGVRILALASTCNIDLALEIARWYPDQCGDCGLAICGCDEGKRKVRVPPPDNAVDLGTRARTPDAWQDRLAAIYGEANRQKGEDATIRHLVEEFYEVSTELVYWDRAKCGHELAQTFAWWFATVTLTGLGRASDLLREGRYPT